MLLNEKLYQRIAKMVAEKLNRAEANSRATPGATPGAMPGATPGATAARSLSPSFESPTLLTPQSQMSGSSVSRSSSTLSASSIASLGLGDGESQLQDDHGIDFQASGEGEDNNESEDEDEDEDDEGNEGGYDMIKQNSRGKRVKYSLDDRTKVTSPVLTLTDSNLLAPIASRLYIQGVKKNGTVKKYTDLDFDSFKGMIKHIIRALAAECSGPNVRQRLFWAAYDVVRKRRANHIQSWRLHGHPKELIYGGKEEFIQKYGDVWTTSKSAKKKKRRRRRRAKRMQVESSALPESQASIHELLYIYLINYQFLYLSCSSNFKIYLIFDDLLRCR